MVIKTYVCLVADYQFILLLAVRMKTRQSITQLCFLVLSPAKGLDSRAEWTF